MLTAPVEDVQDAQERSNEMDQGTTARKIKVTKGSKEEKAFKKSRTDEKNRLINDGPFIQTHVSTLPSSTRVFG